MMLKKEVNVEKSGYEGKNWAEVRIRGKNVQRGYRTKRGYRTMVFTVVASSQHCSQGREVVTGHTALCPACYGIS
jgi:hypothetical protein